MPSPVLITGIGKRIGFALAKGLLARGYPVIGTYRTDYHALEELREAGAVLYQCDFYDEQSLALLLDSIKSGYPRLRAIIHNASDWLPDANDHSPAVTFTRMMQIHAGIPYQINLALKGALEACSATTKDIIHITDYVAEKGSKKHIAYAASKAAMANLTLSFSTLLAPHIKVNSIAPALILFNDGDDDAYREKAVNKALMPREGGLQEVLESVNFIFNSNYVTGRTLALDGGRHLK